MKNIASIMTVLVLLFSILGCQQQKEEKSQTSYMPQTGPSPLELNELEQAVKMSPKSKDVWVNYGNALMDTQHYSEAIEAYQKALALDPKNVSVRVDLGTCYRGVRKFDKAIDEYRKALKIDPNFPNGHRNLACRPGERCAPAQGCGQRVSEISSRSCLMHQTQMRLNRRLSSCPC